MRKAHIKRRTHETFIELKLNVDGRGQYQVSTGIRFFDHMLELFARHGGFDLQLNAKGDLDVDQHHTVEDVGIALGEAFDKALGSKLGILRAGYFVMPMDETLGLAAVDFGGRAVAVVDTKVRQRLVGDLRIMQVGDGFVRLVDEAVGIVVGRQGESGGGKRLLIRNVRKQLRPLADIPALEPVVLQISQG